MGDSKDRAVVEHVSDGRLNELVRIVVHGRRRLVHHHHAAVPKEGTCQAEELPLAHAEVVAVLYHRRFQNAAGGGKALGKFSCTVFSGPSKKYLQMVQAVTAVERRL